MNGHRSTYPPAARPGSFTGIQPITDTSFGQDMLWHRRPGFQLLPQMPHIHAQILIALRAGWPPNLPQQLAMGQHLASVPNQHAEQPVLNWRQPDLLFALVNQPVHRVETHIAELDHLGRSVRSSPAFGSNSSWWFRHHSPASWYW